MEERGRASEAGDGRRMCGQGSGGRCWRGPRGKGVPGVCRLLEKVTEKNRARNVLQNRGRRSQEARGRLCAPGQSCDKSRPSRTRETRDGRQVRPRGAEGAGQDRWTGVETWKNARKRQAYTYFSDTFPNFPAQTRPKAGQGGEPCPASPGKPAEEVSKLCQKCLEGCQKAR